MVRLLPLSQGRRPPYRTTAAPPVTMEALRKGAIQQPVAERPAGPQILQALVPPGQRPAALPAPPAPPPLLQALQKPGEKRPVRADLPVSLPASMQAQPALRENPAKNQNKQSGTQAAKLPAPVLGWHTAASIAEAPAGTALVIENWFCERDALRMRRGYQEHATGGGMAVAPVETLVLYTSGAAEKMFAVCDGDIYDVTDSPTAVATTVTGLTSSRCHYTQFGNTAGQWLLMVNGTNDLITYNGSAWDTVSADLFEEDGTTLLTGLTNIWNYKERVWFTQAGSTDLWYLPVDAITGTAEKVTCGSLLSRGGSMIAGMSWSVSDDSGKEDFLAAMSSEGEVLIFAGDDPSTAEAWDFFGSYFVGSPLGPNCFFKVGGDVLILSQDGILPLSQAIMLDQAVFSTSSMTKNIAPTFADLVHRYKSIAGWQMVTLPTANMAILNVPTLENATAEQIVWNTATGGLSQFTGLDACCWTLFQDEIYFGGSGGVVYKAETGAQDLDAGITAYLLPAYDDLGAPAVLKHIKLIKAIYQTNVATPPEVSIAVDYEDPSTWGTAPGVIGAVFTWDVSEWDEAVWLRSKTFRAWQSGMNIGAAISPAVRVTVEDGGAANDLDYRLFAHHILYEKGGVVG